MDEIFGLNRHLLYVHMPQNYFWKSLHAQSVSFKKFVIEFVFLSTNYPIYEVNQLF